MSDTFSHTVAPPPQFTKPVAAVLFFSLAIMVVAQSCLFTILPPIGRQIGLNEIEIGAVMSIHGVFMLFAGPWWGAFSETAGRRRVILIGAGVYTVSVLAFGLVIEGALRSALTSTTTLWLLIGTRSVFAVGAGAVTPASMALAADLSTREQRLKAMSLLAAAVSTGAILGPSASALFAGLGLSAPFYIISGLGLLAIILSKAVLPVTRPHVHASSPSFRNLLQGRVLAIAVSSWCFMCGNYGTYAIFGFFVQDHYHLNAVDATQWMGIGLMSASAISVLSQTFVVNRVKVSAMIMVLVGSALCMMAFYWVWHTTDQFSFVFALMLNGFGQSLVNPAIATSLSLSVGASGQGRLAGLSTSTQALAFLVAPFSAAVLYSHQPIIPFYAGAIFIAAAMAITVAVHRRPQTLPSDI
ncbi:MAG: MFS transporter [Rhodospirillaceae bacterium]|nr:MFS transporter [Rhodospirillaceae bacterium]